VAPTVEAIIYEKMSLHKRWHSYVEHRRDETYATYTRGFRKAASKVKHTLTVGAGKRGAAGRDTASPNAAAAAAAAAAPPSRRRRDGTSSPAGDTAGPNARQEGQEEGREAGQASAGRQAGTSARDIHPHLHALPLVPLVFCYDIVLVLSVLVFPAAVPAPGGEGCTQLRDGLNRYSNHAGPDQTILESKILSSRKGNLLEKGVSVCPRAISAMLMYSDDVLKPLVIWNHHRSNNEFASFVIRAESQRPAPHAETSQVDAFPFFVSFFALLARVTTCR